jgi:hypothetical protein
VTVRKRRLLVVAPAVLVTVMLLVFQGLARLVGSDAAWYLGLVIYWLAWGVALPAYALGWRRLRPRLALRRPDGWTVALASIVLAVTVVGRVAAGSAYPHDTWLALALLVTVALANGVFEEVGWRGVYLEAFRGQPLLSIVWPSLGFGLWHLAPGSVAAGGGVVTLALAAAAFGLVLALVAARSGVGWAVLLHTAAGLIQVV